jgi:hypothetical protein
MRHLGCVAEGRDFEPSPATLRKLDALDAGALRPLGLAVFSPRERRPRRLGFREVEAPVLLEAA